MMIKKIMKHFKNIREYKDAKKTLTLMILNQYSDFLGTEKLAKDAEIKAYESMSVFEDTFKPEDLQNLIASVNTIVSSPQLQTEFYTHVHNDAQTEK